MKRFLAALLLLLAPPALAQEQDVFGTWKTEPSAEGAYLRVYIAPCGYDTALTCGQIVDATGTARDDLVGKAIITGMEPDGAARWSGGEIWAPDDDKTYRSSMRLEGGALTVKGCVAVFCRSQSWTRVE